MSRHATPLLAARGLVKRFRRRRGFVDRLLGRKDRVLTAVDGIDLDLAAGEVLGLVGESGCGKSTLGRCLVGIHQPDAGQIAVEGRPLHAGRRDGPDPRLKLQMVFQDPYSSLNPRMTIGAALEEVLIVRGGANDTADRRATVARLLDDVGLGRRFAERFPHELSGGQRQRVSIARALAAAPEIIVADEPVSALDVSVQAQIINLLQDLQRRHGLSIIFISHDLGVVRHICDRVMVMYLGEIVEARAAEDLFARPLHPYTRALLSAVPDPDPDTRTRAVALPGEVPDPYATIQGCRFAGRCAHAQDRCRTERPPLRPPNVAGAHPEGTARVRCHFVEEIDRSVT